MSHQEELDQLCINTIRTLAMDAVQKANSGHPGMPMGAAPMAYVLWTRFLKHNPTNPHWPDRDRFVLSAGHGSMLLYSLLHLTGYDLPLEELQDFRQWGSRTAGHPEYGLTPGVETTTGPLGQGFANGVGMALAERFLAEHFNRPDHTIVDHYTYAIVSDGDLMEGVASEAASLAGHLGLGKLIYLYDDNHISIEGSTDLTFTEDVERRFKAYGWHVQRVDDGNDTAAIAAAIEAAQAATEQPSLIMVRTHIAYGSPGKQDTAEAHGAPLGEEEVRRTKENLGWPTEPPFYIPDEVLPRFREAVERGRAWEAEWQARQEGTYVSRIAESDDEDVADAAGLELSAPDMPAADLPPAGEDDTSHGVGSVVSDWWNKMRGKSGAQDKSEPPVTEDVTAPEMPMAEDMPVELPADEPAAEAAPAEEADAGDTGNASDDDGKAAKGSSKGKSAGKSKKKK